MKTRHTLQKWFLCLSLLVFFCVFPSVSTSTVHAQKVEIEQFNNLRQMVTELQKQSTEQEQDSQKLNTHLTESVDREETGLSEAQYTDNKRADESASYLADYKQNLTELQKQTDSLNKTTKRMERQRDLAWIVAGSLLVWGCTR